MIFTIDDVIKELNNKYTYVTDKSLEKLCKKVWAGIQRELRNGEVIELTMSEGQLAYIRDHLSPTEANNRLIDNKRRRIIRQRRKDGYYDKQSE